MDRDELEELHYIVELSNVPSILRLGILSHNKTKKIPHKTIANQEVQELRSKKAVPPGDKKLHDYANLYFCARNPMLYKRKSMHERLCVLRISTDILDLHGVVITDRNASSKYVRFRPAADGIDIVDKELTFAKYWKNLDDADEISNWRRISAKCAEVLVPECLENKYIIGAYVSNDLSKDRLIKIVPDLSVTVNRDLFFL